MLRLGTDRSHRKESHGVLKRKQSNRICSPNNAPNHKTMLSIQTQLVFQTGRYRFQDLTGVCGHVKRSVVSLRSVGWVGVCPCTRRFRIVSDASCLWTVHVMHVVSVQVFSNCGCSIFTRGRGAHVRLCPRPYSSTHRSAKPTTERHRGLRNTARSVLSRPFIRVPTACVSSPRDWAVSNGSHMQQDTVNSPAPPRLRRAFV